MTIIVERLLWCDGGAGCPVEEPSNADAAKQGMTNNQVRSQAASNGWVNRGRKDYGEVCAERLGL